jgi:uncharacterized protein DUF3857
VARASRGTRRLLSLAGSLLLAYGLLTGGASAKEAAPSWLREAASASLPPYDPTVPAVVLLDEETRTLDEHGHAAGTERFAVRILQREGRQYAVAREDYANPGGSVRDLKAWLIRASGEVVPYGKGDALDAAVFWNDVYDDQRFRAIDAIKDAEVGSVFGFEATFDERLFANQFLFAFQQNLPVLRSSFAIETPPGWRVSAVSFNHAPVEPSVSGTRTAWELRGLPYIASEPLMPPLQAITPWLAVSASPPPGAHPSDAASFASWTEVAGWLDARCAPAAVPNAAIASKATALAGAASSEYARIRSIGRYVQSLNYIEIQMGTARGEGYRPHPAAEVFAKSYGDCKDKANLMKTMLGCVGIESYLAVISADDSSQVRPEWPSPRVFNHCIVAVRVSSDSLGAAVDCSGFGRLLFFDPTDPETPLGDLPPDEQGSWTLLVSPRGDLVRTPVSAADRNRCERTIEAEVDASGSVRGRIAESAFGWLGSEERRRFHNLPSEDYRRYREDRIVRGSESPTVSSLTARDDEGMRAFESKLEFSSPRCAQVMSGGRLLLLRPRLAAAPGDAAPDASTRTLPMILRALAVRESTVTKLPDGFDVESLPRPLALDGPFGSYRCSYAVRDGRLIMARHLSRPAMTVAPADYGRLREFLERARSFEETPIALIKR